RLTMPAKMTYVASGVNSREYASASPASHARRMRSRLSATPTGMSFMISPLSADCMKLIVHAALTFVKLVESQDDRRRTHSEPHGTRPRCAVDSGAAHGGTASSVRHPPLRPPDPEGF